MAKPTTAKCNERGSMDSGRTVMLAAGSLFWNSMIPCFLSLENPYTSVITFVFFLRTAQLIKIIHATTPDNRPTVANPRAKSYHSENPRFPNVPAIPTAVPCPLPKAISNKATAIDGKTKNGFKINTANNIQTTYCPNPIVQPKD